MTEETFPANFMEDPHYLSPEKEKEIRDFFSVSSPVDIQQADDNIFWEKLKYKSTHRKIIWFSPTMSTFWLILGLLFIFLGVLFFLLTADIVFILWWGVGAWDMYLAYRMKRRGQ